MVSRHVYLPAAALLLLTCAVLGSGWAAAAKANTFAVTTTGDSGDNNNPLNGSLRDAIIRSNGLAGPDLIDATGVSGTIDLESELPLLRDDVEIRGPGAGELTLRRVPDDSTDRFRILSMQGSSVEISGLTITNGSFLGGSDGGGGILNRFGALTLRKTVVNGNRSFGTGSGANGGGISNFGAMTRAELTLIDSTVNGNTAAGAGGGIHSNGNGNVTLVRSTVSDNTSQGGAGCGGGGGVASAGDIAVIQSTISGNEVTNPGAPEIGGGIHVCSTVPTSLIATSSTLAANAASLGANLAVTPMSNDNTLSLRSTILADPQGGGENCSVAVDGFASLGYNLADDASCRLTGTADQAGSDPSLGPLAANGGATRTHALSPSSPAVDAGTGDGQQVDQRGFPRPVDVAGIANAAGGDGADVGAFELQQPAAPPPANATPPSNQFSFEKLKKKRRKGIAVLTVAIPGSGKLVLAKNRKLKRAAKERQAAGRVKLKLRPRGKARRRLSPKRLRARGKRRAKTRVRAKVTYTPSGGEPRTKVRKLKLVRVLRKGRM